MDFSLIFYYYDLGFFLVFYYWIIYKYLYKYLLNSDICLDLKMVEPPLNLIKFWFEKWEKSINLQADYSCSALSACTSHVEKDKNKVMNTFKTDHGDFVGNWVWHTRVRSTKWMCTLPVMTLPKSVNERKVENASVSLSPDKLSFQDELVYLCTYVSHKNMIIHSLL